jgi:MscS family membrane protein
MEFFAHVYYGNTLFDWTVTLFMMLGSALAARALYWVLGTWVKRLTMKSKTTLDDLMLQIVQGPIVLLLALTGMHLSLMRLHLPDNVRTAVGNVFSVVVALNVAWLLTRAYQGLHEGYLIPAAAKSETTFDDHILPFLRSGITLVIWALGLIIGLNNAGFNVGALLAGMGLGGLAFALAAQDTIANVFGGLTIFVQRPFKIGDLIIFDGRTGRVKEIGLRTTRLEDFTTAHAVFIPNSQFTKSSIVNVTADPGHWVPRTYRLPPDTSAAKVELAIATIRKAVSGHPDIDKVNCRLNTFDNYTVELYTEYHVRSFGDRWRVITEVHLAIMRVFEENGLRFALPVRLIQEDRQTKEEIEQPTSR